MATCFYTWLLILQYVIGYSKTYLFILYLMEKKNFKSKAESWREILSITTIHIITVCRYSYLCPISLRIDGWKIYIEAFSYCVSHIGAKESKKKRNFFDHVKNLPLHSKFSGPSEGMNKIKCLLTEWKLSEYQIK